MAHVVDSSVWVALFLDFDTQHKKAVRLTERLSGTIYLPYGVISEVVTVLAYKHSKKQADSFINFVQDNRDITLVESNSVREVDFYTSRKACISFTDATVLMLSKKYKAALVTFDKQLQRLAKKT